MIPKKAFDVAKHDRCITCEQSRTNLTLFRGCFTVSLAVLGQPLFKFSVLLLQLTDH